MENNNKISQLFWNNKIKDKDPIDELNGKLESFNLHIESNELSFLYKIANNNILSQFSVVASVYSILLDKYFENYNGIITSYNSLVGNKDNSAFFLENNSNILKRSFKEHLQVVSKEVQNNLAYIEYGSTFLNLDFYSNYAITLNNPLISEDKCRGVLLNFNITNEILELTVFFDESFVDKSLMQHFGLNFTKFLIQLQEFIDKDVNEFDFLTEEEKHKLLVEFNDTKVDYAMDKTIVELFEEQVERSSENVAIVFEDIELTYSELNEAANQLGNYLRHNYNIQPDDLIAIKLERSEKMIIAIFGILKSGGAYVPIDLNYPQERIDYIEKDTSAKVTIDDAFFENFENQKANYIKENLAIISKPNNIVYVIYTSGTTGQPKGVMIENSGLVNRLTWMQKAYPLSKADTLIQKTTYSFDVSVWELLWWSLNGAKLSIPKSGSEKDPAELIENIYKNKVTVMHFVPSMLSVFLEFIKENASQKAYLKTLKQVFVSGEALILHQRKLFYNELPHISLMNLYGPTEASIDVSHYNCGEQHNISSIPIGKPIDNTSLYILDEKFDLIPIGVVGKLYISGTGLSRGYLNKLELTAEKFIDNPFEAGTKMYDTGDLARWLPDGNIEFLGRKDFQVKIRGFRIELGEIENAILEFSEDLKQVVVDVKENKQDKGLIAYLACSSNIDKSALRNFLQNSLPDYMIPSFYVVLESLPLTPNGKLDRKALQNVGGEDIIRKEYSAPSTKTEEILAAIWQEVLGIDKIGVNDNFFDLGGHSLMISQVTNRIHKQLGKTISFKIFFANPIIKDLSEQLKESKYLSIPNATEAVAYPLTASQSRFWVLSQLEGGSLAYNITAAVKLTGKVDFDKFEESFQLLINRYEILRTYFKSNVEGEVQQYILPSEKVAFKIILKDFSEIENQENEVANYLQEISNTSFDLEKGPLIRASLIKLKDKEYVFFLSLHHIIGDGWSLELLISEIVKIYNDLVEGRTINLPELSIQYKDYAVWLNEELYQEKYLASEKYWVQKFKGEIPVLNLPSFNKRPLVQTFNGNTISHQFANTFLEKLKVFSKEQDVTLFMTLMSGIKALLYRYTGQDDIIVGTPIAGREHPDLENQMGLFLNTLPIRTQFKEKSTFLELLAKEKETLLEAYDYQNYPFDVLVGKLNLKRDTSRSALFDVLVVLQNQSQLNNLNNQKFLNVEIEDYEFKSKTSKFDINFTFIETTKFVLKIDYNTDVYDKYLIERIFSHFENLLQQLINNPERKIQEIDYLTEVEKLQLLVNFNDTKVDYPKDKTIIDLFEEQVGKTPDNVAIIFEDVELTYKELNEKTNQFGHYLRENYQINPGDLIGIKLNRSEKMIFAILGILKSGAVYVPIDPSYPKERIKYIEKDSKSKIVIDESELERFYKNQKQYSKNNIKKINAPNDLAYIIYTSGTTGDPKGVMIEHKNTVELIYWSKLEFNLSKFDIVYAVTSYCFDLSIYEIFYTLSTGKKIRLLKNAFDINKYLEEDRKILINTVPSVIVKLLHDGISLHNVCNINLAGEVLTPSIIGKLPLDKIEVHNLYGPSEDTTYSTYFRIDKKEYSSIPIGKPISNTKIYILDDDFNLVPIGVVGKLYIAGAGLSRGYLNKSELTTEKFIPNPFQPGKMYDTGDLGYWLTDGNIEFSGRKDGQVKIRGYRIELGEIENAISNYSKKIQQVLVEAKEIKQEKTLVAYYVSKATLNKSKIREYLGEKLPEHMVPSFYIQLDSFPLTANGKLDRKGLPQVKDGDLIKQQYIAPENIIEEGLVAIWQEVLGVEKIGITDNFFDLGGHSLLIIKTLSLINKKFHVTLKFTDFINKPFINRISQDINLLYDKDRSKIRKVKLNKVVATDQQKSIWIECYINKKDKLYNISAEKTIDQHLDLEKVKRFFDAICQKYEILRTVFKEEAGVLYQEIKESIDTSNVIKYFNVNDVLAEDYKILRNNEIKNFNFSDGPLFNVYLYNLNNEKFIISFNINHIICDEWSLEILYNDFNNFYSQEKNFKNEIEIQYNDYANWYSSYLISDVYQGDKDYWNKKMFEKQVSPFPLTLNENNNSKKAGVLSYKFNNNLVKKINLFLKKEGISMFPFLLALTSIFKYKYTQQTKINIGSSVSIRNQHEVIDQIGLFVNTLVNQVKINRENTFEQHLRTVSEIFYKDLDHNTYPYPHLLNSVKAGNSYKLFDTVLTLNKSIFNEINQEFHNEDIIYGEEVEPKTKLLLNFLQSSTSLELNFTFDYTYFERKNADLMVKHIINLLNIVINETTIKIKDINLLTVEEKKISQVSHYRYLPDLLLNVANTKSFKLLDNDNNDVPISSYGKIFIVPTVLSDYSKMPQIEINGNLLIATEFFGRKLNNEYISYLGTSQKLFLFNDHPVFLLEFEELIMKNTGVKDCEILSFTVGENVNIAIYIQSDEDKKIDNLNGDIENIFSEYTVCLIIYQVDKIYRDNLGVAISSFLPQPNFAIKKIKLLPINKLEIEIYNIFKEVLEIEEYGTDDNFFEIGGNSLKAMLLLSKISEKYKYELDIIAFFENPSIKYIGDELSKFLLINEKIEENLNVISKIRI